MKGFIKGVLNVTERMNVIVYDDGGLEITHDDKKLYLEKEYVKELAQILIRAGLIKGEL